MTLEFLAQFPDWRTSPPGADLPTQVARLALALGTSDKTKAQEQLKTWLVGSTDGQGRQDFEAFFLQQREAFLSGLGLLPALPPMSALPYGAWGLHYSFTLLKPYLSKDDTELYIIDNPVRKEWVFRLPTIAASQWKGMLRSAMARRLAESRPELDDKQWLSLRLQLTLLFGNEKDAGLEDERCEAYLDRAGSPDETERQHLARLYRQRLKRRTDTGFLRGRLHFYPAFFTQIGMELINPHSRQSNAGTVPIAMECIPAGAGGEFWLLYLPLDLVGEDLQKVERTARADLLQVQEALPVLFEQYGLGAKTSSGFGLARIDSAGQATNLPAQPDAPAAQKGE